MTIAYRRKMENYMILQKKKDRIDWILYKGAVNVVQYEVVDYNIEGVYPSDHKPIYVEFEIAK
jgi:endonuclease/exonuclease/phosphatase (EEP) superfamily protein YafD